MKRDYSCEAKLLDSLIAVSRFLHNADVPLVLIVVGSLFLLLALVGRFGAYVEVPKERHRLVGGIGSLFLLAGIGTVVVAALPPEGKDSSSHENGDSQNGSEEGAEVSTTPLPITPVVIVADEVEPNNQIYTSNVMNINQNVRGNIRQGDVDWFQFDSKNNHEEINAIIRTNGSHKNVVFTIFDTNEKEIVRIIGDDKSDSKSFEISPNSTYYAHIEVVNSSYLIPPGYNYCKKDCWYEILIK